MEPKYDETEDNDVRAEISPEIEKKQQTKREKYISSQIDRYYIQCQKNNAYNDYALFANDGLNEDVCGKTTKTPS